jgi:hypothetical protein
MLRKYQCWEDGTVTDRDSPPESRGPLSPEAVTFVERMASVLIEAGMQRMAARVFACLMIAEEPSLTSADLARRLQVSPAAISGAVRYLSLVHMVSREREPGSRRERYRLHHSIWYEALAGRDVFLKRWRQIMLEGLDVVPPGSLAAERLTGTSDFMTFLDQEFASMLDRWRERQAAGDSGDTSPDASADTRNGEA